MLNLDSLFLESSFDDDVSLRTTEEGFVWCDCAVDESEVIDTDPFEFITEAMYESISNVSNITFSILAESYNYLKENGYEMVEEDAKEFMNKKKDAIIAFFKKLKQKIINFFTTIVQKMQTLQAKFLLLFKKAQERGKSGFDKLKADEKMAPKYTPSSIALNAIDEINKTVKEEDIELNVGMAPMAPTTWEKELDVIKKYGSYIKDIKNIEKNAHKAIEQQKKDALKDVSDKDKKKEIKSEYAKKANAVLAISKSAISEIMKRVNIAAKIITKSIGQKPDKNEKKATGESAFLDNLEMI